MSSGKVNLINPKNYNTFLTEIKKQIQTSQARAIGAVKSEMIILYFNVGKAITQKGNCPFPFHN